MGYVIRNGFVYTNKNYPGVELTEAELEDFFIAHEEDADVRKGWKQSNIGDFE